MQRTYAKLVEGQLITTCAIEDDLDLINQITADGFKLYDEDAGEPEVGQYQKLEPIYHEQVDKITLYWEIVEDPEKVRQEIARVQEQIAESDYKVIKSYEYVMAGITPPYDPLVLHSERQALRDQIEEMEFRLAPVDDSSQLLPGEIPSKIKEGGDIPVTRV